MIIIECEQGTPEWKRVRLGIPTASCFSKIITPKKLELAAGRFEYRNKLLAEWLTGVPMDSDFATEAMERGTELEDAARKWYAFHHDLIVRKVGFVLTDDGQVGCSPDGLVGEGGLEIKCPMAPKCVHYLLDAKPDDDHRLQLQGSLYVTGLPYWDVLVWNPDMDRIPPTIVRVTPDTLAQDAIENHLRTFTSELNQAKLHLIEKGCKPALAPSPTVAELWRTT